MKNNIALITAIVATSQILLSACGVQPYDKNKKATKGFVLAATEELQVPDSSGNASGSATGAGSTTGILPVSQRVGGFGYNTAGTPTTTIEVRVNSVLKVKFTPGIQDQNASGTGFTPHYSGLGVYIKVGSIEQATPLLKNAYNGATAETSDVMDFSGAFTKTCPTSNLGCRQTVAVTVIKPNYDHYCLINGIYCSWTHVWDTHPWNGTLSIQTDDTDPI